MQNGRLFSRFLSSLLLFVALQSAFSVQAVSEAARTKAMDAIEAKFRVLSKLPAEQRDKQMIAFMKAQPVVFRAGIMADGTLSLLFKDKVPYQIVTGYRNDPKDEAKPNAEKPKPPFLLRFNTPNPGPLVERMSIVEAAPEPFLAPFALPQFQGNDLPESTKARVVFALGNAFKNMCGDVRNLLSANGYTVAPGEDGSVETLMTSVNGDGVFFMQCHGGMGETYDPVTKKNATEYILTSGDVFSDAKTTKFRGLRLFEEGYLGLSYAAADYANLLHLSTVDKRYYTLTKKFIKKYWKFSKNSFVFVSACTSIHLKDVMATSDVNASVYAGFDSLSNSNTHKASKFLFDRMLGANEYGPDEPGWPQRPFDFADISHDTKWTAMWPVMVKHDGKTDPVKLQFSPGRDDFGLLAPSLKFVRPVPYESRLELHGMFGVDPGHTNRKVEINNIAMVVDKWEPDKIVVLLPNSEEGTCGEVKVTHRGRVSNSRWLSEWKGTANITITGEDTLKFEAIFKLRFVADPWPYREHAGDKPTEQFVWGMSCATGSTCTWSAGGEKRDSDGKLLAKWSGNGNPKPQIDVGLNFNKTFGVGGNGDTYNKWVWLTFTIVDTFRYEWPGVLNPDAPIKLAAFLNGQSAVTMKLNSGFGITGGNTEIIDEPSKVSYGGQNAKATWSTMACGLSMPNNARR